MFYGYRLLRICIKLQMLKNNTYLYHWKTSYENNKFSTNIYASISRYPCDCDGQCIGQDGDTTLFSRM